jgi:hypothetical protein
MGKKYHTVGTVPQFNAKMVVKYNAKYKIMYSHSKGPQGSK